MWQKFWARQCGIKLSSVKSKQKLPQIREELQPSQANKDFSVQIAKNIMLRTPRLRSGPYLPIGPQGPDLRAQNARGRKKHRGVIFLWIGSATVECTWHFDSKSQTFQDFSRLFKVFEKTHWVFEGARRVAFSSHSRYSRADCKQSANELMSPHSTVALPIHRKVILKQYRDSVVTNKLSDVSQEWQLRDRDHRITF